jgi:uncharacterized membrane protein (DUF2068 family)
MARPTGVTILGILGILWGGFVVALSFLLFLGLAIVSWFMAGLPAMFLAFGGAAIGGFFLVYGILHLLVGVGLLRLAEWARVLAMVLAAINLAFAVLRLLAIFIPFFFFFAFRRLFVCAADVLILWYLSQPQIKQAFSRQDEKT